MKKIINTESTGYMLASGVLSYGNTILSEAIISGIMDTLFVPKASKTARILTRIGKSGIVLATYPAIWRSWWHWIDSAAETVNAIGDVVSNVISVRTVDGDTAEAIRTILTEKDTEDKDRVYKQESQQALVNHYVNEILDGADSQMNKSADAPAEEK